jgi:membrane associated rhomboid family serine protease
MLADRSYMQDPEFSQRPRLSGTVRLMILLGVVFCLQTFSTPLHLDWLYPYLVLQGTSVLHGYVWQFLTYQVLHAGFLHIAFNLLALFCFGRVFEMYYGARRLYLFFFLTGVAGGVLHVITGLLLQDWAGPVVGASAGTSGLLAAFCLLHPEGTVLLYFVPVKAKYVLIISLVLSLVFTILPGAGGSVAHAAHLGGLLAGIAFMRFGLPGAAWVESLGTGSSESEDRPRRAAPAWAVESDPAPRPQAPGDFISREIDPILEKISSHGFQSLTEKEKQILASARDRMKGR